MRLVVDDPGHAEDVGQQDELVLSADLGEEAEHREPFVVGQLQLADKPVERPGEAWHHGEQTLVVRGHVPASGCRNASTGA